MCIQNRSGCSFVSVLHETTTTCHHVLCLCHGVSSTCVVVNLINPSIVRWKSLSISVLAGMSSRACSQKGKHSLEQSCSINGSFLMGVLPERCMLKSRCIKFDNSRIIVFKCTCPCTSLPKYSQKHFYLIKLLNHQYSIDILQQKQ